MDYRCKQINEALKDGNFSICEKILQDGFDPNQLGSDGVSPMHLAAGLGIKAVCLLLQHGGNPNIKSSDGTTPVHIASMWGEPDCLQILLANGGDPFLEDQDGLNALDLAKQYDHQETVLVLEQYMALLNVPTEDTIAPKYTYTRRSTGSAASVRSESPDLADVTLEDTQKLHEYLQEFTKRRRSSVYLRSLQSDMNKYFNDGQKTHLIDVTSPDHPYIEPRHITGSIGNEKPCPSIKGGTSPENRYPLSPVEESLHLQLSLSDDELSKSCDSFVTCDGEGLDQLNRAFDDASNDSTDPLNTDIKNSKFPTDFSLENENNSNSNQSCQKSMVRKPIRSRGDRYCRRVPLFLPPESEELSSVECDLCGRMVVDYVQNANETVCKSCDKLNKELDDLIIDKSHEKPVFENKNNNFQPIDEIIFKLRQSSLHRNPKVNVHNIPFKAYTKELKNDKMPLILNKVPYCGSTKDWETNSLISSDESFIGPREGIVKSEFHPSDFSTITESDLDSVKDEAFIGQSNENGSAVLKNEIDFRKKNAPTKARFQDRDLSTIAEVTEPYSACSTLSLQKNNLRNNAPVCANNNRNFSHKEENRFGRIDQNIPESGPDAVETKKDTAGVPDQDNVDLWDEVRAKTMRDKNFLDTGFIRRDSFCSLASDATTVEYIYTDPEHDITLIERHIPSVCGSVRSRRSIDSQFSLISQDSKGRNSAGKQEARSSGESEDTEIYDWREEAMCEGFSLKDEAVSMKSPAIKPDLNKLDNKTIRAKLCKHGDEPGPVTDCTRQTYLNRLSQIENNPDAKILTKKSPEYPPELRCALSGNFDLSKMGAEEDKMFADFQNPKRHIRWREGTLKSSFNYILLDPRITKNLPNRSCNMNDLDTFQCFVTAIFYVGKGKRARPYSHLYEAIKHMQKPRGKASSKVAKILEIWSAGLGVVSLHCFQSVIPVEAYTREACMVDALGLHKLTNMKRGDYYGIAATYSMKKKREMGVYLLTKALQIFLAEGERQILPADLKTDWGG